MKTIGVIGAGQMGNGIAHVCAVSGYDVKLLDVNPAALAKALEAVGKNLDRQIKTGAIKESDKPVALARIETGSDYAIFKDCDLVIEAATENEAIKRESFKKLCPCLKPAALIASNTSSISITRLPRRPTGRRSSSACIS